MGNVFRHIQGHISGAFRPRGLPTGVPSTDIPEYTPPTENLVLWLNPNDETTLDSPTGMTYAVDDKSGAGNHVTAQASKPLGIRANPRVPLRRMVRVEHGEGSSGSFARLNGLVSTLNTATWTLIMVVDSPAITNGTIFAARNTGATDPAITIGNVSGKWRLTLRNSGTATATSSTNLDSRPHVITVRLDGTNAVLRVDGVQEATVAWNKTNSTNSACFGTGETTTVTNSSDVLIGTVLCYSTNLSNEACAEIEAELLAQEAQDVTGYVTPPSAMLGNPRFACPTLIDGAYSSTYSTRFHYGSSSLTTYYVDPLNGDNADPGTEAQPFKDVNTALGQSDVQSVILAAGIYTQDEPWTTYTGPNKPVIISCPSGRAVVGKFETASWALTAAQTYTYQHTLVGTLSRMHDAGVRDADGIPTVLTSRASVALVEANPGSYFNDAGTLYVHTADSRPADRSVLVELTAPTAPQVPFSSTGRFLVLQNIDFVGTQPNYNITGCNFYLEDVRTSYAGESSVTNPFEIVRLNCVSKYTPTTGDHWDYRGDVRGFEQGCIVRNTGTDDADNCSTAHGTAMITRIRCEYTDARRAVHDIEATKSWNLGCDASDSVTGGANTDHGWTCGDIGVSSTAQMWLDGCTASGNTVDIFTGVNATTRYRNMTIGDFATTTESGGTLTTY